MTHRSWAALAIVLALAGFSSFAGAAVGRTPGQFAVTPSGSAQYTIPVWTPTGSGGLRPELAFNYHHARDNGIVGMGFVVTGFSTIARCPKTSAQDGVFERVTLSSSDKYCLDGERLRLTSGVYGLAGSTYRTEVDRVVRVTAFGGSGSDGPAYFEAWHKNGLIFEYGNSDGASADARIEATANVARAWGLNAIRDRSGNRIDFKYLEDTTNGVFRPDEISYATNVAAGVSIAPYLIKFEYDPGFRPDPIVGQHPFGGAMTENKRLARVEVRYQGSPIKIYRLTYESGTGGRSRLDELQECSISAAPADCLKPTKFDWTTATAAFEGEQTLPSGIPLDVHLLDIDGDGRDDLVYVSSAGPGGTWRIRKALAGGGFGSEIDTTRGNTNYTAALPLEWDGDGRADLLVPYTGNQWHVLRSNGAGFDTPWPTGITAVDAYNHTRAYDINGDKRHDLVRVSSSGAATVWVRYRGDTNFGSEEQLWSSGDPNVSFYTWASGPLSPVNFRYRSTVRQADFDGDQREDFIAWLSVFDPESQGSVLFVSRFYAGVAGGPIEIAQDLGGNYVFGELNDDGLTDLVWITNSGELRLLYGGTTQVITGPSAATHYHYTYVITDFDGDGRQDVLAQRPSTTALEYFRSSGLGLAAPTTTGLSHPAFSTYRIGNVNGDAHADVVSISGSTVKYGLHQPTPADLLTKATDGFDVAATFEYTPMSDPAVHTKSSGTVFPDRDVAYGRPIVKRVIATDGSGTGATFNLAFTYEGARQNLKGRGFLGFAKRTTTDSRTGIQTEESFAQNSTLYASVGLPTSTIIRRSGGGLKIGETTNTWSEHIFELGTWDERRLAYPASRLSDDYEVNVGGSQDGTKFRTTTTTNTVDVYGTITDTTTETTELATGQNPNAKHKQRTQLPVPQLVNNEANWCLGRPGQTLVTRDHMLTHGDSLTRRMDQQWNAPKCRATSETIEPTSSAALTTAYQYDDDAAPSFGNVTQMTVSASGQADRVTSTLWHATGRFPSSITNAEGHVTQSTWDLALAAPESETAPNGVVTLFDHDAFGRLEKITHADSTRTMREITECNSGNSYCGTDSRARYQIHTTQRQSNETTIISEAAQVLDAFDHSVRSRRLLDYANVSLVDSTYDTFGRPATVTAPYFSGATTFLTSHAYDLIGRHKQSSRPESDAPSAPTVTSKTFYEGLTRRFEDMHAKQTRTVTNGIGDIIAVTNGYGSADAASSSYTYDAFGNLKTLVGPDGRTITHSFNERAFRSQTVDPNMGTWTYEYWPTGELRRLRDAKTLSGWTTTMAYDRLGRMTQRTDVAENTTTTWAWDAHTGATCSEGQSGGWGRGSLGSVAQVQGSTTQYSESYCYDSLGRLSAKSVTVAGQGTFGFQWGYAPLTGFLDSLTYPAAPGGARLGLRYEYSNAQLQRISYVDQPTHIPYSASSPTARGQMRFRIADISGLYRIDEFSEFDAVTGLLRTRDAIGIDYNEDTPIQDTDYEWDSAGNLELRRDNFHMYNGQPVTERFEYDSLYRLDRVRDAFNALKLDVDYASNGNIMRKSDIGGDTLYEYFDGAHPHAATRAGPNAYTYDANGNLITRNGQSTLWYSYNLPQRINYGSDFSEFLYGPDRQRYWQNAFNSALAKNETVLSIDGLFEKRTYGSETNYSYFIYAEGEAVVLGNWWSGTYFHFYALHRDALGSVVAVSDPGYPFLWQSVDAWGQRRHSDHWTSAPPTLPEYATYRYLGRRGFTGHEHLDNLNLIHMNGRVYAPVIGRFMSPDPFIVDAYDSQALNRYSYARNNPTSRVDPSGFTDFGVTFTPPTFTWPGYLAPPGTTSLSFVWPASIGREFGLDPDQLTVDFAELNEAKSFGPAMQGDPLEWLCSTGVAFCFGVVYPQQAWYQLKEAIGYNWWTTDVDLYTCGVGCAKAGDGAADSPLAPYTHTKTKGELVTEAASLASLSPALRGVLAGERILATGETIAGAGTARAASAGVTSTQRLIATHGRTMSRRELELLKQDIAANGIKEPIKYVEIAGQRYVVDGHHRLMAARQLGMREVPTHEVQLPYAGYKTVGDLLDRGW